jgi:hypothetical protein
VLFKFIALLSVFAIGEVFINLTLFHYLRRHYQAAELVNNERLFFLRISVFKGVLERFVLLVALILNLGQILIVFGALKLGTRLDDKSIKVNNDYFLIGNFCTLLTAFTYFFFYNKLLSSVYFEGLRRFFGFE